MKKISIHALLTESDPNALATMFTQTQFQSTLSSRRATSSPSVRLSNVSHFNPRSPHGERLRGVHKILGN